MFYEGYGLKQRRQEIWNGIRIIRIPLVPRGKTKIGLIANYFSFMFSGLIWVGTHRINADLIFSFETSPMTQVMIGCKAKKKENIPHYLYVQDLWPENVEAITGIHNPVIITPINRMVDYIYRNTDQIFATSLSFVEAIVNRKRSVQREKVHFWPQYTESFYEKLDRKTVYDQADQDSSINRIPKDDSFKIIFTGNIGFAQGLDILPRTAELIKAKRDREQRPIRFVIVGDGRYRQTLESEIRNRKVQDMFIQIPRQAPQEIPKLIACSDAAFLSFQDIDLWDMTIPAKLQSYMACGIPVIAAAKGESRRVIKEADCGLCCDTGDAQGLADAIARVMSLPGETLHRMGTNGVVYCKEHFDKNVLLDEMEQHFKETGTIPKIRTYDRRTLTSKNRTAKMKTSLQASFLQENVMETVFVKNEGSRQTITIPEQYRASDDEMYINRIGQILFLLPKDNAWEEVLRGLEMFTEDFMESGRGELAYEKREAL